MPKLHLITLAARRRRRASSSRRRRSSGVNDVLTELWRLLAWMGMGIIIFIVAWLFITIDFNDAALIEQRAQQLAAFFGYQPEEMPEPIQARDTAANQAAKQQLLESLERALLTYEEMDWENMSASKRRHFELQQQLLQHEVKTLRRDLR